MTQRTAPKTHPSQTTAGAQQALDLLDELDDYLSQIKKEAGSGSVDAPAKTPPPTRRREQLPTSPQQQTTRRPSGGDVPDDQAVVASKAKEGVPPTKSTTKPSRSTPTGKPSTTPVRPSGDRPVDAGQDDLDHRRRQLDAHQRKIEKAWKALRREKAALAQQQLQLKADRQSLENELRRPGEGSNDQRRLDLYRDKLQERYNALRASEAVVDLARQQYAELLDQRESLIEVKHFLASAEQEMIRRWSVHRGVGLVGGVVSCLLFLLLFSYHFGHRIVQPVWRASTVVGVTATVFDESRYGDAWMTQQHQLMVGDELLAEAIRLGAQRGVRIFDDTGAMRDALNHGLTVSQPAPGRIQMEFRHTDRDLVVGVLGALSRALVNYHTQEDRVAGRPNSMRIYEAAARDPQPVEDLRMAASVITLVVATVVVIVMSLFLRWWLARSVRVFEERGIPEMADLEDPQRWPEEPAIAATESSGQEQTSPDSCDVSEQGEAQDDDVAQSESDEEELTEHAA